MQKADDYTIEQHYKSLALRLRIRAFSAKAGVARDELQRLSELYMQLAEDENPSNFSPKSQTV